MSLPEQGAKRDLTVASITAAILIAVFGGSYAAKQLLESGAAVRTASSTFGARQAQTHRHYGAKEVPFLGPYKLGRCGPDVRLMEGALRRVHVRKTKAAPCLGKATRRQLIAFQKRIHYRPSGVYNLATHRALVKRHAYTARARNDLIYYQAKLVHDHTSKTVLIVTSHAFVVAGGSSWPYCQSGQRSYFPAWPRLPPCTDCSGFATWVAYQSGYGPAVGYFGPGSGVGWTGTLARQGVVVNANGPLRVGDFIFYGRGYPWGHVAIYIGHGRVISHGGPGMKNLPYNYRAVGQVRRYF